MNLAKKAEEFIRSHSRKFSKMLRTTAGACAVASLVLLALFSVDAQPAQSAKSKSVGAGPGNPILYRHYKGLEAFGVPDAWRQGITGQGVNVAVIDDGIDFGNADLYGSQARVTTKGSPYFGWPIVIDLWSIKDWQERGGLGHGMTEYADTASTDVKGYTVTGTSKSGVYHIGPHPDMRLKDQRGERVRILLVDEKESGVYDTVYVDLNGNRDFRDDKACRKGDEISVWDRDGDGLPDETGGMLYFIADGTTPPPLGKLLYGNAAKVPKRAELVALFYPRTSHGTMCAGTIGARGKVVRGIAPGAQFIPVLSTAEDQKEVLLSSLGYDGVPNTGDEANVISRSGAFGFAQKGADELSVILEYLTTKVVPNVTFVYGANNEGSGHGSSGAPSSDHVIMAGAIEDLWFKGSPNRGDVATFSGRGPNALGQVKPNVLGTGAFAPRVRPLIFTHSGATSYDRHGGGTSNGTPHVAGIVALIYQAYKEAHGAFPTSEIARDILMSSADDINEEPFAQGAGIINARRAVEIAKGKTGVLLEPAVYSPSTPLAAGSTENFRIAFKNYDNKRITAVPQHLVRTGSSTFKIPASQVRQLFPVPKAAIGGDVLKISSFVARRPHDQALKDTYATGYWISAYNWRDLNHDGKSSSSSSVTAENAQQGEVELLANTDWGPGSTDEVRIHDPLKRVGDGLLLGFAHTGDDPGGERSNDADSVQDADVTVVVESFTWQAWDALQVTPTKGALECRLKAPQSSGVYQGRILLTSDNGKNRHSVPVSFASYLPNEIRLVNTQDIYENDKLYARLEGTGRFGFRDGRFYPVSISGAKRVAIKASWQDPGTDLDLALFGKGSVDSSKIWDFPAAAPVKLPVLPVLTASGRTLRRIETVHPLTPATEKTVVADVQDGLYFLVAMAANSGRTTYGERISFEMSPMPAITPVASMQEMTGVAGQTLEQATSADAILGFGERVEVKAWREPQRFEAHRGEHVWVNLPRFGVEIYADSNGNGKFDQDVDEVILRDELNDELVPSSGQAVALPYDGTYFVQCGTCSYAVLPHRYEVEQGKASIAVPRKAGTYVGVAVKGGSPALGEIKLTVHAAEARRIELKSSSAVNRALPVGVDLQLVDAFGNPVSQEMDAAVSMQGNVQNLKLTAGKGHVQFAATGKNGEFPVTARTVLGVDLTTVKVNDAPSTDTEASSGSMPAAKVVPVSSKPRSTTSAESRPARITGLKASSDKDGVRFTWKAPANSDIDHYIIYRMSRDWRKEAETNQPEYLLKSGLWVSNTIRVVAVDKNGAESEPSDPCGAVLTPAGS